MADFKGGDVVVVPLPVNPEMVLWALPGPAGDIPYADVENLVNAEFTERIDTMTQLEASASASAGTATTAAGTATTKASAASASEANALAYRNTANTAAGTATTQAGIATTAAGTAEQYALEFDLGVTATTGAPGSNVVATVTGTGPAYQINLTIPQGAKGETGDDGEISQAQLDAAVATLVDNAPEALNTLSELATSLGNDPNFATTVSTEIGKRVLIDGAPASYNTLGKLVTALQNHELGGSTDAGVLQGALTDQVDASAAMVEHANAPMPLSLGDLLNGLLANSGQIAALGSGKSDVGHTHTKIEVGLSDVDNTSDTAKPVSTAQQTAINAKVTNAGGATGLWIGTSASLPTTGTAGVLYVTTD